MSECRRVVGGGSGVCGDACALVIMPTGVDARHSSSIAGAGRYSDWLRLGARGCSGGESRPDE